MPEHRADLASVPVDFPNLDPAQTSRHIKLAARAVAYLEREGVELDVEDLTFLRSAQVAERRFWIWSFRDDLNELAYVTALEDPRGRVSLGYDDADGLTPEQALLAEYHGCY